VAVVVFVQIYHQDVAFEMNLVRTSTEALAAAMEALPATTFVLGHNDASASGPGTTTQPSHAFRIHDDLAFSGYAGEVWGGLLQSIPAVERNQLAVVEVGMHSAMQCLQAAREGYQAHCLEPSPRSFRRITQTVRKAEPYVQERIHLYNVAAGGEESTVPFVTNGGTGDHVVEIDMWKMQTVSQSEELTGDSQIIQVPSKPLDTVLGHIPEVIHLLKIDTQGFEPQVFAGLENILSQKRAKYILTEFWPRGMDIIAGKNNRECIGIPKVLARLVEHGYRLFALPVEAHPKAPIFKMMGQIQKTRPFDEVNKYCQWFYELEDKYPSEEYRMGYWTDFLAISSYAELPQQLKELPVY
jgi:FkbM family methyltransferase